MYNSNQISFLQLLGLVLVPTVLFCGIHLFPKDNAVEKVPLELIAKANTVTKINLEKRFAKRVPPMEPQEIIEEYVYDIVVHEEHALRDTLETDIIVVTDIHECRCISNYHPIRLIEAFEEEEVYSILPEPIEIDPSIFEAKLYPNPAIDFSNLELNIEMENKFEINLYDLSGQLVQNVYSGFLDSGRQKFDIDLYDLVTGMYIVHVSSAQQNETLKIQKI
ncbi:MAG: T9SS type A sorting domain-containing protein [Crocinitomix sp.]|nr:T9SS type A sorting domain-containing protein [Crocinitomix sp.]